MPGCPICGKWAYGKHHCVPPEPEPSANMYGTEPYKLHRTDAPATSVAAAYAVDTKSRERFVHELIRESHWQGIIMDEPVVRYRGILPYSSLTARCAALRRKGLIVSGPDRRLGSSGSPQYVHRSVEYSTPEQRAFTAQHWHTDVADDDDGDDE